MLTILVTAAIGLLIGGATANFAILSLVRPLHWLRLRHAPDAVNYLGIDYVIRWDDGHRAYVRVSHWHPRQWWCLAHRIVWYPVGPPWSSVGEAEGCVRRRIRDQVLHDVRRPVWHRAQALRDGVPLTTLEGAEDSPQTVSKTAVS